MRAIEWSTLRGQEFTGTEAREASDFSEIVDNLGLSEEEAYDLFKEDQLSVGKRMFFAETIPLAKATLLLILDTDERVRGIVDARLKEGRDKENGGIII